MALGRPPPCEILICAMSDHWNEQEAIGMPRPALAQPQEGLPALVRAYFRLVSKEGELTHVAVAEIEDGGLLSVDLHERA